MSQKIYKYHKEGEQVNKNYADRFGTPSRSLYTTSKVFTLHHKMTITDENETPVYNVKSKAISLHDKTDITNAEGNQVAHIERKVISLHERHIVTMADGKVFEFSNEFFHIIKDVTNLEGLGWQLRGNILELNFELYDRDGSIIAVIGQKLISLHDKYCIDIYKPEYEETIIAILVTLQHMICDRETRRALSSSSGSGSSSH